MRYLTVTVSLFMFWLPSVRAGCPIDHILIGCNPSGIVETDDDMQLFFDVTQKYRQSDPNQVGESTWLNWYYPMSEPGWLSPNHYRRQVPGFDWNSAPAHQLDGDYEVWIECIAISPGLDARTGDASVTITKAGDEFYFDGHFHMWYRVPEAQADPNQAYWITFQAYDKLGNYLPSEPTTIVFMNAPLEGDLTLDGTVGRADLMFFLDYWLAYSDATRYNARGQAAYDLFERADINRDYRVDIADFSILAQQWLFGAEAEN